MQRLAVKVLGEAHGVDPVELVASEPADNAVQHSAIGLGRNKGGLAIVDAISSHWGVIGGCSARSVWAEISMPEGAQYG